MKRTNSRGRKLCPLDREALERALEQERQMSSSADRVHLDEQLKCRGWFSVAEDAAYICQRKNLQLKLWQPVPFYITDIAGTIAKGDDGISGDYRAALLLKRMLAAGLSRYEPDPVRALARAKERQQRAGSEPETRPPAV